MAAQLQEASAKNERLKGLVDNRTCECVICYEERPISEMRRNDGCQHAAVCAGCVDGLHKAGRGCPLCYADIHGVRFDAEHRATVDEHVAEGGYEFTVD